MPGSRVVRITVKVGPTTASVTQIAVNLPGKVQINDALEINGISSVHYDSVNLVPVPSVTTGITGTSRALIRFQASSASIHFVQASIVYNTN